MLQLVLGLPGGAGKGRQTAKGATSNLLTISCNYIYNGDLYSLPAWHTSLSMHSLWVFNIMRVSMRAGLHLKEMAIVNLSYKMHWRDARSNNLESRYQWYF